MHTGGVNVSLCDGAVRFVSDTVELTTWQSLSGMADGSTQFISEFVDAKDNNAVFALLGSMRDGMLAGLAQAGN
jgi:prepilin-type processing-associated H-X9-DG protein